MIYEIVDLYLLLLQLFIQMDKLIIFFIIWITCTINDAVSVKVSFYGASHIAMPLQEAKISTNIRLRFRTRQDNTFILLAAGRTDYCLLGLESGRVKFNFKVDDFMTELWSPKNHYFNDLQWHDVAIQRYETNLTLQVDEYFIRKTLPIRITEFNIHFGVFLGGLGDFSESYVAAIDNFRGCISDVYYNNINVFKRAKEGTSHVSSIQVSWTCSPEFDATEHQSMSFVNDDAYVMLAKPTVQAGESWSLELRTIETLATIIYNSATDFVGLEVVDGKLRLLVGKGSNAVELVTEGFISDGKWHNVSISYGPINVELTLDSTRYSANFAKGSSSILELDEEYYIGGLGGHRKKKAVMKGLRGVEQSLRGCIRNLLVDSQPVGFPHMKVTQGVVVDCVWSYPCIEKSPCIMSSSCQQYGVEDFICYCDQAFCIKADYTYRYKIFTKSELPVEIELLAITPLQVLEGDSVFLSTLVIDVLIDYTKLHIMEAGVVFNIVQAPKHGRISINTFADETTNGTTQSKFFSLIDVSTDKIKYTHNGLEQFSDHMTIDFQLISSNREPLPEFLQGKHRFVLHANITPVNDAPILTIPPNRVVRLTQGIPKIINAELLSAEDPDSLPTALVYSIMVPPNALDQQLSIEIHGKPVTGFSQADLNQGSVTFSTNTQVTEDISFELIVQVSDGIETSPAVYLPISVMPLQLRMINNTGLILVHKSSARITPWNLSFTSNSEEDIIDIKYTIIQPPQFGNIQKLRSVDSSWITVESFNSDQILLGQIRYIHNIGFPVHDEFKFAASFGPVKTIKYDFRMTFTKLRIGIHTQNSLQINGTQETTFQQANLFHQTVPLPTFSRNIIYTVLRPPKYGFIYVNGYPEYAKEMDSFTQQDIDKQLIKYKTHQTCYSSFADLFEFVVSVPECDDLKGSIKMIYNPVESLRSTLSYQTRENIMVYEGQRTLVTRKNFEVLFNKFNYLTFNLTTPPNNGILCTVDEVTERITEITSFTLDSLYLADIYYCHDNSETTFDSMNVLVLSDAETDFQFVCEVFINITLVNDNPPYRFGNGPFYIVRNGNKTLTENDLKYIDPDINTNSTQIMYNHIATTNGIFYKDNVITEHFSQADIRNGRILFKHIDTDNGNATFSITDGLHSILGHLHIIASDPFIKIIEHNASVVQEGKFIYITSSELSIKTNLNSKSNEIEYRIVNDPNYGFLKIVKTKINGTISLPRSGNNTSVKSFTQEDVEKERLIYWSTEVASMDKIKYRVIANGISAEGEVLIRIYPAAYWDLLQIRRNQTLYVEESTSVIISRDILEIVHPNISPGDITYLVKISPQHGYLEVQSITSDDEYNCKVFDQSTINSEKMFYIQAGVNQSSDYFIFDVTNGITWLKGLVLKIIIIPENLYMESVKTTIEEGQTLKLDASMMIPYSEYYNGKILEYKIIQQPAFGYVRAGKSKVNRFTQKQLEAGNVYFVHDGSENATDSIKFVAITRNKESFPYLLIINISPINDELPQIITNTGLQMWVGGKGIIKDTDLMAQDYDTTPDALVFVVSDTIGGHIVNKDHSNKTIMNFTQADIDKEKIFFCHDPIYVNGEIRFVVTDGDHTTPEHVLHIITNPVTLELITNDNLHVFPLTRKQILRDQLNYQCSDRDREVIFIVTITPQTGRILYEFGENGTTIEVNEFTQQDVNNGRIFYEHTHSMIELKSNDSFYFDVTAKLANSLIDQIFNIEISVSSGGLLRFLPVPRIHVDEGGSAQIKLDLSKVLEYLETKAGIIAPELYIDSYLPNHGHVEMIDLKKNLSRFSLNDFNTGKVIYRHDHSDTLEDRILMSVFLTQGQIFLCNLSIPIVVNPVNDHPFYLVTQSPQLSVVEGENGTITKNELFTNDIDTGPINIIYDIISGPTLGALMKVSEEGVAQDVITYGNQFSQQDINEHRIQYVHFGAAQSTTFYFKVSDGKFKPAYEVFNLKVFPITISPGLESEIVSVAQGSNAALIKSVNVPVGTNALKSRLVYNITDNPSNGYLLINHKTNTYFTHAQLDENQVNYIQTDMNKSSDSFKVSVYVPDASLITSVNFHVKIIVEPFIKINGISLISSDKIRLTFTIVMDNSTQLKLNRYNPKITITKKPDHGKIRKIIRTSGDMEHLNDRDTNSFTFKELKSGIVYFVARKLPDEVLSINDYFEYILYIKTVQPAQGFVPIEIHKVTTSHITPKNGDSAQDINITSFESFSFNYFLIISMIAIMVALATIMIVLMKCRTRDMQKIDHDKDFPPPLPRPPDFVGLNNNNNNNNNSRIYSSSDGGDSIPHTASSTPIPVLSSIPHCKVIPIDLDDSGDSDDLVDMNLDGQPLSTRYPYNDDNCDEWSSTCDIAPDVNYTAIAQPQQRHNNPLLRRNQYWV